jgi:hypothetical protein
LPSVPRLPSLLAAALLVVSTTTRPAEAQRILYYASDGTTSTTALLDLATGVSTPVDDEAIGSAVFTADGQYLIRTVGSSPTTTRLRHVPLGLEVTLAWPFVPQVAHPRQLAVFGAIDGALTRLDESGVTTWSPCGAGVNVPFQLSDDGARIFTVCPTGHFLVLDAQSGAVVRDTTIGADSSILSFASSPDGSEVVVFRTVGMSGEVARLDAVSGATLRARLPTNPQGIFGRVYAVPGGTRFIEALSVIGTPGNSGVEARLVDFATLNAFPQLVANRSPFGPRVVVSMDGREGYFSWITVFSSFISSTVTRFDLTSGAMLGTASAPTLAVVAVASLPHPVEALAALVSGPSVALSWRLPPLSPAATGYRLAIGTAPGATDLGSIALGPAESFTAAAVPRGRYYVRVHSVNVTGTSGPSAEIVVDVP